MTLSWKVIVVVSLAGCLASCGGSRLVTEKPIGQTSSSAEGQSGRAALANVSVSPDIPVRSERLPRSVVCHGDPTWLPISWNGLPPAAGEVVIEVSALGRPEFLSQHQRSVSAQDVYVIAGIAPSVDHLGESLPPGAYVVSEPGATICPRVQQGQRFAFTLYALPKGRTFRELIDASVSIEDFWRRLVQRIIGVGSLSVRYPGHED